MKFDETFPPFEKDYKKLLKYNSLPDDFENFKLALSVDGVNIASRYKRIPCGGKITTPFYKAVKFRCKTLKGGAMSGIRVIFCYQEELEQLVTFVEMYYHEDRDNHDMERIKNFCKEKGLPC